MNTAVQDSLQSKLLFGLLHPPRRAARRAPFPPLVILVAIAAFFAVAPRLYAGAPATVMKFVTLGEVRAGSLLLRSEGDRYIEAPLVATDFDVTISGPTARGRVTQIFHNPTEGWVEAVYVYPLSEGSAVDTLKMVVGDRVVIAEIQERKKARETYEQARAAGQMTALMEQERPNIFTNSVANIGPGESVVVQIEYQEPVRQSGSEFSLRLPLVVAPRYNPRPIVQTVDLREGGYGTVVDPVPDRDRIEPPVLDPRVYGPVNPVSISVRLNAGFLLGEVKSHHHTVEVNALADDARVIKLSDRSVPADRDFELTWTAAAGAAPAVGLFRERVGDADYLLAFVTPPVVLQSQSDESRPREVILVIDNSGSMGGTSMVQAKASLIYALGRLKPTDRFNVIRFDNTYDVLFPDAVPADARNVAHAKAFVSALEARGGTEMVPAMKAALTDRRAGDSSLLRQVVFVTDGAIGNEQQLLDTIVVMRGRSRVFMVGIGSAPNSYLMTRAAELGRGTFTHIGSAEQVDERMRALYAKLESPVVTNLSAIFSAAGADVTPIALPDLYRGEPVALTARVSALQGTLEIKGTIGDRPWIVTLPLANAAEGAGLSKLWARRKIADAEVARTLRTITTEEADKRILELALGHHLVTRLTSLIAVDKTPSRPEGARLTRADVPLNLPAGWEFDKVFGPSREAPGNRSPVPIERRAEATEAQKALRVAYTQVTQSPTPQAPTAKMPGGAPGQPTVPLPRTATDAEIRIMLGLMLLVASVILLIMRRRRVAYAR